MSDMPPQPGAAPSVRVCLVVDDDSLDRFGDICKHIVVGLMDATSRVVVVARTTLPPPALALGPCEIFHAPPPRWPFRATLPESVTELARDGRIDAVLCLSADLMRWVMTYEVFRRLPVAAHLTDAVDIRTWNEIQTERPGLFGLPATPTLFREALRAKRVPVHQLKLVRLGVIGEAGSDVLAGDPRHLASVLSFTPLTPDSGLELVLQALARVTATTGREQAVFILGNGPYEQRLRRLAAVLGIRHAVTFVGELAQWQEAVLACDMLLVPRATTRWRSLVLQAMAHGRTILAPADTGEDYLTDGETACLFRRGDVDSLAAQWSSLLTDPDKAARLASNARRFVKTHHSIGAMAGELVSVFSEMLGRSGGSPSAS